MSFLTTAVLTVLVFVTGASAEVDDHVMNPPQDTVVFPTASADGDVTVRIVERFPDTDVVATVHVTAAESGADVAAAIDKALLDLNYGQVFLNEALITFPVNGGFVSVEATNGSLALPMRPQDLDAVLDGRKLTVSWSTPVESPMYDKIHVIIDGEALDFVDARSPLTIDLDESFISPPDAQDGNYRVAFVGEHERVRGSRATTASRPSKQ